MPEQTFQCVVMFADVVGSTAMYDNMGDAEARERLSKALNTLISISRRHKGKLVKTIGDEIMVYFMDVDMSILAAQNIQQAMEDDRSPVTVGISIKIGLHYGSVIFDNNDIYGDTVNVAARIAGISKARQILYSGVLSDQIRSADLISQTRKFDVVKVKGKQAYLDVYQLIWEEEGEVTDMQTGEIFAIPCNMKQFKELQVSYKSQAFRIDLSSKSVSFGRDDICDVKISGPLISRLHFSIAIQRGKFTLIDQSTNGSYVCINDEQNIFLRREQLTLFGNGKVSFGKPIAECGTNVMHYSCC